MRQKSKIILFPLIFSITMSCNHDSQKEGDSIAMIYEIDYTLEGSQNSISSIVDTVEFIPLYGSVENPISHVDELQVTHNRLYILDRRRNELHVYEKQGNRLFTLKSTGHAEDEYLEIASFAATDSSIFIVDNYQNKIIQYHSTNGNFQKSHKAPIVISGIRALNNNDFILAELPIEGVTQLEGSDGNRLYIADNSFNIKSSFYPYGSKRDKIGMGRFFSDNDSVILYSSAGHNGFTEISANDGGIIGNVSLKTKKPYDKHKIAEMSIQDACNYIEQEQWQFLTTTPLMSGKYVCLSVRDNDTSEPCIYDTDSNKLYFNNKKSMHNNLIAPDDAFGDSFYTIYNFGAQFLDSQLELGFNRPFSVADSIIRNDGTVLLRHKMK